MTSTAPHQGAGPVQVLYVAGSGRSGTTVINTILGQLPGAFAAGELRYLWHRGVVEDHRCGCGEPFSTCPVWSAVMADLRPLEAADAEGVAVRLLDRLRILRLPVLLGRRLLRRSPVPPHPDDERIAALYHAIAAHTGASVIVDSSKLPPYGLLLQALPGLDVRILHVVRDPRATAYSWRRTKKTQDTTAGTLMPRMDVGKSSLLWLLWNLLTDRLWPSRRPDTLRFRYEDFVASPRRHMVLVAELAGLPADALPFVSDDEVTLAPTHSVAGNPNRHTTGTVRIRGDMEWRGSMPARERLVVTALTALGIARFRYPWAVRSRDRRGPAESQGES